MADLNGITEGVPLSLSRYTDVLASKDKWAWFVQSMHEGRMLAFDPRNAIPRYWSTLPGQTAGIVFWTKNPTRLLGSTHLVEGHLVSVHMTITGWTEAERGAPSIEAAAEMLNRTVEVFGADAVTWRFSPVPLVPDAAERFARINALVTPLVDSVYVSFLQSNDRVPETRTVEERQEMLRRMAEVTTRQVLLCAEDRSLVGATGPSNLATGICAPPSRFGSAIPTRSEGCGCVLMADPFTRNESCGLGCTYCYAADASTSAKKRSTFLTVLKG